MKPIYPRNPALAGALLLALLVGCASTPQRIAELEAARSEVQQASADPLAQQAAGIRLKQANEALALAEESARRRKPMEQIRQESYVAQRNAQIAKEQIAELRARQEVEQGEAARNRVLLEARTTEARTAQADAERARQEAAAQGAQAAAAKEQASSAADEAARLRGELEQLQAKPTERGMVLTLGDVLFATGQASLRSGAMLTVDRLSEFLRNHQSLSIVVEGHTDSVGSDDYNLDLSQRRADAVRQALISRGTADERIMARGMGEAFPVATNDNGGGRQQNRRVEIIFSDEQGKFLPGADRPSRS